MARLSSSALNNEFFTHASQSWKERLAEGTLPHQPRTSSEPPEQVPSLCCDLAGLNGFDLFDL